MNILHPIKSFNDFLLKNFIKNALEHIPELKQAGLNYLRTHKDEILEAVKAAIISAVKKFIEAKAAKVKEQIVGVTSSTN